VSPLSFSPLFFACHADEKGRSPLLFLLRPPLLSLVKVSNVLFPSPFLPGSNEPGWRRTFFPFQGDHFPASLVKNGFSATFFPPLDAHLYYFISSVLFFFLFPSFVALSPLEKKFFPSLLLAGEAFLFFRSLPLNEKRVLSLLFPRENERTVTLFSLSSPSLLLYDME